MTHHAYEPERTPGEKGGEILTVASENVPEWQALSAYLKRRGFAVWHTTDPGSATRVLRGQPIRVVLSDYDLPGTSALAFLRQTKTLAPNVELIFLSRNPTLSKAIEAMREGAYDFYEFPLSRRLLLAVVEKALEKEALSEEKSSLERQVKERRGCGKIVGRSKAIQSLLEVIASIARKSVTVLLTGETGTGKELVANAIHACSHRAPHPFIRVNCAAYNEGVIESELFGHEKGAFTGAVSRRIGRFELADGGTIFLDEVGDIPPATQIKLLRVIQEREFERLGGSATISTDVRIVAATNRDLRELIREGRFREDLFYRLNVVHVEVPPLVRRKEDIPLLVSHFIAKFNDEKGYRIKGITQDAMRMLLNYQWPGNVRELENAIESAMALTKSDRIESSYLPAFLLLTNPHNSAFYQLPQDFTLKRMEEEVIKLTLEKTGGNKTKAAALLGIGLRTLQRKTKKMALEEVEAARESGALPVR